jgi:hypothetical protein
LRLQCHVRDFLSPFYSRGSSHAVFCNIPRCVFVTSMRMYVTSHQASINPDCSSFGNCAECQDKLFIISNWFSPRLILSLWRYTSHALTLASTAGWTSLPSLLPPSPWFLNQSPC